MNGGRRLTTQIGVARRARRRGRENVREREGTGGEEGRGGRVGRGRNRGHCDEKGGKSGRAGDWPLLLPRRRVLRIKGTGSMPPRGLPPRGPPSSATHGFPTSAAACNGIGCDRAAWSGRSSRVYTWPDREDTTVNSSENSRRAPAESNPRSELDSCINSISGTLFLWVQAGF